MKERIRAIFQESIEIKQQSLDKNIDAIEQAVAGITESFNNDGKVILFGNGGSAADSQHIAAEFVGRFQKERKSLPAIALTTDTSILTSLGNDYSFDIIFSRQIEGLANKQDIVIGISTSGNSQNVIQAVEAAKEKGLKTITLTGGDGGRLGGLSDININVPSKVTARIQEVHSCIGHCICELVENNFC